MRMAKHFISIAAVLIVTVSTADAGCFRGKPYPECRVFWITEAGFMYRFDSPGLKDKQSQEHYLSRPGLMQSRDYYLGNLGLMVNIDAHNAVGGLLAFGVDYSVDDWRTYVGARFRRWLSESVAADVTAGIIRTALSRQKINFFSEISMMLSDQVGVSARMEWVRRPDYATASHDVSWYGGVRLGSEWGAVVAAILLPMLAL